MNLPVVSTAKQAQRLADAAAAVFVITQDDIRRAGVTSVPEALRLAPGVEVARIDANKWAISARGLNGRFANKLLVLIDGRSVYTPTFSGVYWEVQDLLLENIDRIEIIRGPGAALWGANAVNGVINILTKHSADTQGGLVTLTAGDEERAIASARYGGKLGDRGYYRLHGKYRKRDALADKEGDDADDDGRLGGGGFRLDWQPSSINTFTLQGDVYSGDFNHNLTVPSSSPPFSRRERDEARDSGGNLLGRWQYTLSPTSRMSLQMYYQRLKWDSALSKQKETTFDVDFQHNFAVGERQEIVWGLGYRSYEDDFENDGKFISFTPSSRRYDVFNAFAQDRISLLADQLELTLGTKLEHNDFTGWELQPSARLLWTPHRQHRLWAAVSRAVRTPARADSDASLRLIGLPPDPRIPPGFPNPAGVVVLQAQEDFDSERLIAYELGYRTWPTSRLSLDAALFYNDYEDLRALERREGQITFTNGELQLPFAFVNATEGSTRGIELAADWRVTDGWRLQLAYSYLRANFKQKSGFGTLLPQITDGSNTRQRVSLRSSFDIRPDLEVDLWLRYVDDIPDLRISTLEGTRIDDYLTMDARIGWRPYRDLELSIVGANLLGGGHAEFVQELYPFPTEVERSVHGQLKWAF